MKTSKKSGTPVKKRKSQTATSKKNSLTSKNNGGKK